ncbi:MAG: hypothetical protein E6J31_05340 [Chloroflexi bacterium]|nr:MAG: hypothetical protein E6J31_05340 [Chloroflexota bacterium]
MLSPSLPRAPESSFDRPAPSPARNSRTPTPGEEDLDGKVGCDPSQARQADGESVMTADEGDLSGLIRCSDHARLNANGAN